MAVPNPAEDERFLLQVITDGEENASRRYSHEQITQMLAKRQDSGAWTVRFLGSKGVREMANAWQIPLGNCGIINSEKEVMTSGLAANSAGAQIYYNSATRATANFGGTGTVVDFTQKEGDE